jgi:phage terminase large subunit-like protein
MSGPKAILDACCGGRMSWFDKQNPHTVYIDNRRAEKGHIGMGYNPNHTVQPDVIMDFRQMTFADRSFKLVVFDPPHMTRLKETSITRKKYGVLNPETWQNDLHRGFNECWRVLEDYGVLIFKWAESEIPLRQVLVLFEQKPLFGHTTGSKSKTHWMCFMKMPDEGKINGSN